MHNKLAQKKAKSKIAGWEPTWYREHRQASFTNRTSFWQDRALLPAFSSIWNGNAAYDLLKLEKNEGADYSEDLNLLFAACGDLSCPITTINALPRTYAGRCTVVINDAVQFIIIRNVIILLISFCFKPGDAANIMMHLWYSAFLPTDMVEKIQNRLRPVIQETLATIMDLGLEFSEQVMTHKTFVYYGTKMTLYLPTSFWSNIWFLLDFDIDPLKARQSRVDGMSHPTRLDPRHAFWLRQPGSRRIADSRFIETGILAPLGQDVTGYTVPNPLVFRAVEEDVGWHQTNGSLPPESWPLSGIKATLKSSALPIDDLYGGTALYIQQTLKQFCEQLVRFPISIAVYREDFADLPAVLVRSQFDRIDVSNAFEFYRTPPNPLLLMPHIRRPTQNPHATLVTSIERCLKMHADNEHVALTHDARTKCDAFWELKQYQTDHPVYTTANDPNAPWPVKFRLVRDLYTDPRGYFETVYTALGFKSATEEAGAVLKSENTVLPEWPNRPVKDPRAKNGDGTVKREELNAAKEEIYNINTVSLAAGWERYLEWRFPRAGADEYKPRVEDYADVLVRMRNMALQHGYELGEIGAKLDRCLMVESKKVEIVPNEQQTPKDTKIHATNGEQDTDVPGRAESEFDSE